MGKPAAGLSFEPPVTDDWVEAQALKAARRLRRQISSPAIFVCELEAIIRESYLRGVDDARSACELRAEEARGVKRDGKPRSFPLRPSRWLGATECALMLADLRKSLNGSNT